MTKPSDPKGYVDQLIAEAQAAQVPVVYKMISELVVRGDHQVNVRMFVGPDEDHLQLVGLLRLTLNEAIRLESMIAVGMSIAGGQFIWTSRLPNGRELTLRLP